jgi:protein-S-isoprenylcysteine O-methyltransferase Ste14
MLKRAEQPGDQTGTTFASLADMVAAALVPLMFILGLVVLFVMGEWPMSWLPGLAVLALLVGLAIGLSRMLTHLDDQHTPH